MYFAQPTALWLLVLVPVVYVLLSYGQRRRLAFLRRFGDLTLLSQTPSRFPRLRQEWVIALLFLLTLGCSFIALSDPRYATGPARLRSGVLDVVMLIDVSKSMAAEDYGSGSRLDQARKISRHLLDQLQGNRVGLVTYAGISFRQADLTEDLDALDFILEHWVASESVRVGGSDLATALETGLSMFEEEDASRERLMLVFSDGGADEAFHAALSKIKQKGVRLAVLGLGKTTPSRIPQYDERSQFVSYLKIDGNVVTTRLNEAVLKKVAAETDGLYLHIQSGNEWQRILSRSKVAGALYEHEERKMFQPFLLAGLLAFAAQTLVIRL